MKLKVIFSLMFVTVVCLSKQNPQVVITLVIDQFAYHEMQKIAPFMTGGLKKLWDNGIIYTNAFHPHGMPETGPGHAVIGTGAVARDMGIVANKFMLDGKEVQCDEDPSPDARLLNNDEAKRGRSARNIRVDTLADQLMLASSEHQKNTVYSLSLKSRAAIGMSGRKGQPFWFDGDTGNFTSSKAFFAELPEWVDTFNKEQNISHLKSFIWAKAYHEDYEGYKFPYISNYSHAEMSNTIIGKEQYINERQKPPFDFYMKTPQANKLLLDFAYRCFELNKPQNDHERLILNISLSGLDKIGHIYGPQSMEAIDMLYHMDKQIGEFMRKIEENFDQQKIIFVLTSDHGVSPVLANLKDQGIDFAGIRSGKKIKNDLNIMISKETSIDDFILKVTMPFIYFNRSLLKKVSVSEQATIIKCIKEYMRQQPFVQDIWTCDELINLPVSEHDFRWALKNQLFHERSGDMILLLQPFNYITNYTAGTTHVTPYNYDRQVPLVVYQPKVYEKKHINDRVYVNQISVTLAYLLNVPRPSAAQFDILPGIIPIETHVP